MKITAAFHADLKARWEEAKAASSEEKLTYELWGKQLAKKVGRPRPFDKGQISRFIEKRHTSAEVLEAVCDYFGIPNPILNPESVAEVEWFAAGQTLAKLNPREFDRLLRIAKSKADSEIELTQPERDVAADPGALNT